LVEFHAVWINHFSSSEATFPFQLERVEYDANTANLVGMDIQILIYTDDALPLTNATLVYTEVVPVQTQTGTNVYTLTTPVVFNDPTDIIIGFSSIYADGGIAWPGDRRPMTLDQTASQGDSWVGWMATTATPVDVSNLGSLTNFGTIDSFGLPGHWHNRGYGNIVQAQVPDISISKTPATQDVTTGGNAEFTITVTNTGDVDLANVNVSDPLVAACDNAIGALTVGASSAYSCTDVGVGASYTNVATATSQLVTGAPGPSASASAVVNVNDPTSVSLSGFGSDSAAFSPVWLVALLAVVVGFGFVIRRKLTA
jgi:uncharacterized repeat protein (TIGR01451 family)